MTCSAVPNLHKQSAGIEYPYAHAHGAIGALLTGLRLDLCNGCDGCGSRCTHGVPMTYVEFEAIQTFLGATPARADLPTASRPAGTEVGRGVADRFSELEEVYANFSDDPVWGKKCRFRDSVRGRCLIYPVRPLVCRLMGHVWWLPCPIERIECSVPVSAVNAALDAYCQLERVPYAEWEQRSAV